VANRKITSIDDLSAKDIQSIEKKTQSIEITFQSIKTNIQSIEKVFESIEQKQFFNRLKKFNRLKHVSNN